MKLKEKTLNKIIELLQEAGLVEKQRVSCKSELAGSVELLGELMMASRPYLRRKKMTARADCKELNRVWAKCSDYIEKQNAEHEARL